MLHGFEMLRTCMTRLRPMRILVGAAMVVTAAVPSAAQTPIDAHQIYEQKCRKCHFEHAADMGRMKLEIVGDALKVQSSGKPVEKLLGNHHGVKLAADETAALVELMRNGIRWGGVFQHRCAGCHKQAASFARETLDLKDGAPVTRRDGADVRRLLATHGEATATEIDALVEMLAYQLRTGPVR